MRKCKTCLVEKELIEFSPRKDRPGNYYSECRNCRVLRGRQNYFQRKQTDPFRLRLWAVKGKCNQFSLPFDLSVEYLESIWVGKCAISNSFIDLFGERTDPFHAELDRIIPEKGYIQGNVQWVSRKFNILKSNSTFEEIKILYDYFDQLRKEYA